MIYIDVQRRERRTSERLAEVASRYQGDTFAQTITLTAGLGRIGGAQALAVKMNASSALCDFGWRSACASTGCAGLLPSPFRFIGYNGYPGHGDPAHVGANAHLHLSWQHTPAAPGSLAARVQTLLSPPGEQHP